MSIDVCRRHDWVPTTDTDRIDDTTVTGYACTRCPSTTDPCGTCTKPLPSSADRTCPQCVSDTRTLVRDIRDLYGRLPDVIAAAAGLHAIRYDRGGAKTKTSDTTLLGGDALVLATAGSMQSTVGPARERVDWWLATAEQADPPSVLAVLTTWEDTWRAERHEPAADVTTVNAAVEYLASHTTWAAQTSDTWPDYLTDLRALFGRLRAVSGLSTRPVESDVPCPYCAGTILQRWRDVDPTHPGSGGLEDVRRCDGCGIEWKSEAVFMLAIRQAHQDLPDTHPDQLVTIADAKRIYKPRGVRPNTLDVWVTRGTLRAATGADGRPQRDVRGDLLYRLGTIDLCIAMREKTA